MREAMCGALLALLLMPRPATAQGCRPQGSDTILTVVAGPAFANRAGNTPLDRFVTSQAQTFSGARAYSPDTLGKLAFDDLSLVLPYDGQRHVFTGPRLAAVLDDAGASGHGASVNGIDGYQIDFSAADILRLHPILALCRDGQRLGIGDLGPGFIVYAPQAGERPSDAEFARMVWGVYFIRPL